MRCVRLKENQQRGMNPILRFNIKYAERYSLQIYLFKDMLVKIWVEATYM